MKEWICQEEPLIRADGASVGVGFRQMTELVRCKDCRYSLPSSENFIMCTAPYESQYPKAYKPIDWFCKGGERKEGEGE